MTKSADTCAWSNHPDAGTQSVALRDFGIAATGTIAVCPTHHDQMRAYLQRTQRQRPGLRGLLGLCLISALAPIFITSELGVAIPLLTVGLTVVLFPFAPPMAIARNGVAKSLRALRMVGTIFVVVGIAFVWLGLN